MPVPDLFQKRNAAFIVGAVLILVIVGGMMIPTHYIYADDCQGLSGLANPVGCVLNSIGNGFVKAILLLVSSLFVNVVAASITIVVTIVDLVLTVTEVLVGMFMDAVMNWVVNVPYTPLNSTLPASNPITIGWNMTRDLADMGLVFVLIAIAVSTILNIKGIAERWGKTFITFVGVALIINFSLVITGFLIDITNILAKLFLGQATGGWQLFIANNAIANVQQMWNALATIATGVGNPTAGIYILIQAIVGIAFTTASITAFTVMTFILSARVLALWLLVILSPLAFLLYILPETRSTSMKWWHNFWQWAIIPIPLGFFFWLASQMKQLGATLCLNTSAIGTYWNSSNTDPHFLNTSFQTLITALQGTNSPIAHMCDAMMLIMALGTLFVGFFISFSFSAAGSRIIVAQGTKAGVALGTAVAYGTGKVIGAGYGKVAEPLGRKVGGTVGGAISNSRVAALAGKVPGAAGAANLGGRAAAGAYKYAKMGTQKSLQYGLPLTKQGLQKMGKAGAAMGGKAGAVISSTAGAMERGVFEPGLKADFTYVATELSVQFTDTSRDTIGPGPGPVPPASAKGMPGPGVIVSWNWNFGDGTTSSAKNPTHTYAAGSFNVTLTVKNSYEKTASVSKNVSVSTSSGGGSQYQQTAAKVGAWRQRQGLPPISAPSGVASSGSMQTAEGTTSASPPKKKTSSPAAAPLPQTQIPRSQAMPSAAELYAAYQKQKTTEMMVRLLTSIALTSAETLRTLRGTEEERKKFRKQRDDIMRTILNTIKPRDMRVIANNPIAAESLKQALHETLSGPNREPAQQFVRNNEEFARHLVASPAQELNVSTAERARILVELLDL